MLHILRALAKVHGIDPNIVIKRNCGPQPVCKYEPLTNTIHLNFHDESYAEQVFILLHEYRHAIQAHAVMFPDMLFTDWKSGLKYREEYYALPWEVDANLWAYKTGQEMGFFPVGFVPRWLSNAA